MSCSSHYFHQKGMTLLEVLVAMTLMVIISVISYASLNGLIEAKLQTDKVSDNLRQELLTSQQLKKDFDAIINRPIKDEFGQVKQAIIGRYSHIEFSRNGHSNPLKQQRSELQRVQWYVNDHTLYRRWLNQLDMGLSPRWRERPYLENVNQLNITFTNISGQASPIWPLENPIALSFVNMELILDNDIKLNYVLGVNQ